MKVVLDTNVIVSALINPNGLPAKLLNLILNRTLILAYDDRILAEYQNVFERQKFNFDPKLIQVLLDFFVCEGMLIHAISSDINFNDNEDKKFYEVFKSGKIGFLITGNIKDFPEEWNILTPKEFMDLINAI